MAWSKLSGWSDTSSLYFPFGRKHRCVLRFCRDATYLRFESWACMKDHDSACGNHDVLACFWISSRARVSASHGERAKVDDHDGFPLQQGGLEEFKKPIQQRGRVCFRDPGFLMDALSDVLLLHRTPSPPKTLLQ